MPANNEIIPQSVREDVWEALQSAEAVLTLIRRGVSGQNYDLTGCIERARAALATRFTPTPNTDSVPAGMRLVPVEPTEAMKLAADRAFDLMPSSVEELANVYRVMLAAAPTGSSDSYTPAESGK